MQIGDIVVHTKGPYSGGLFCGSGTYTHAIIVNLDPFVLVSEEGDMLWRRQSLNDFVSVGAASKEVYRVAQARWDKERGITTDSGVESPRKTAWSNKDPRETLSYGRYNIVILRPNHIGRLDWAASATVDTKHGWDIRTEFEDHPTLETWDPLWWWVQGPLL